MVAYTTTYNLKKPTVADDEDVWGGYLNDSMDIIDDVLDGTVPVTGIDINSGTLDNVVIGGTTANSGTFTVLSATTSLGVTGNITVSGTVDGVDIATRDGVLTTTTTTANAALPKAGGTMTGAITFAAGQSFDGRDVSADGAKLDGIESGATADQTAAEIRALVESATDSNVFTDADHTKLNGIEAGATADQTASEILTLIKTVDGAGSGLDADTLDGVSSGSFLRSDAADTATGDITFSGAAQFSGTIGNSTTSLDSVRIGRSSGGDPQIQLTGNGVNAHIDFSNTSGEDYDVRLINSATNQLDIQGTSSTGLKSNGSTVWHAGNDGAGSGLDADTVDGIQASSFLRSDTADSTASTISFTGDIQVGDQIFHHGDTDTYMQFHAANQWRVVTGGTEMLEVNDSNIIMSASLALGGNTINDVEDIYLRDKLFHSGDTDTYLGFGTNTINLVTGNTTTQITNAGVFLTNSSVHEDYDALSGTAPTVDPNNGGMFSLTMTGNTTFTFGGTTSGYSAGFIIQLTGNGGTVTWPTSVKWAGGTAPDAPASGETDILVFITRDGGTNWYGVLSSDAAA